MDKERIRNWVGAVPAMVQKQVLRRDGERKEGSSKPSMNRQVGGWTAGASAVKEGEKVPVRTQWGGDAVAGLE